MVGWGSESASGSVISSTSGGGSLARSDYSQHFTERPLTVRALKDVQVATIACGVSHMYEIKK